MFLVAFRKDKALLLTIRDAVASFIKDADEATQDMWLKRKADFYIGD